MAKRVLGNDPFLRGAASRGPEVPPAAPAPPVNRARATEGPPPETVDAPPVPVEAGVPATLAEAEAPAELPLPPPKKLARERPPVAGGKGPGSSAKVADPARPAGGAKAAKGPPPEAGPGPEPARRTPVRLPKAKTLPRSPFDLPPPIGNAAAKFVIEVHAEVAAASSLAAGAAPRRPSFDAGHLAADGGLLPADLAAATPSPRVVAVAPLPEKAPPPANFVAITRLPPPSGADAARGLFALVRRLARVDAALPSLEVDEFGRDPAFEARVRPLLAWMYRRYFRVEEHGLDRLPRSGPLILVANRAGAIPWDAAMVNVAAARHGREVRPLLEDAVFHFPFLGVLVNRLGAVRACPENAERVLAAGGAVTVFPEGAGGFAKPFRDRYRLQRFGRGGFVRLALRTGATIVPVAVVGSEETYPLLGRVPAKLLGVPFIPITPTWPWLGAAGLWPLPSKWSIELGEPVDLSGLGPEAATDDVKVMRIADSVRTTIQAMLDGRLAERTAVFGD